MFPPNPILEHEAHQYPRRVVDPRRGRHVRDRVEDDRRTQELVPVVREALLPVPQRDGQEHADDDGVDLWVVDRRGPKLAAWADETPGDADADADTEANKNTNTEGDVRAKGRKAIDQLR